MVVRPSSEQINEEILDRAAGLMAQHGARQTSVQAVADAVGYSKAGLLHRFPSKEALQAAVVASAREQTSALLAEVSDLPAGRERDLRAVTALVALAQRRPGLVALMLASASAREGFDLTEDLAPVGDDVMAAFGVHQPVGQPVGHGAGCPPAADVEDLGRLVAVTGALGALAVTTLALRPLGAEGLDRELAAHVVATCSRALGHGTPTSDPSAPAEKDQ